MIRFSTIKLGLFLFIHSILYSFLYGWVSFISFILLLLAYLGGWVEPWSRHSSYSLRCLANNTLMIRFPTIKLGLFLFIYSILYSFLYGWVSFISFCTIVARLPRRLGRALVSTLILLPQVSRKQYSVFKDHTL
jgi:hypothetical protein